MCVSARYPVVAPGEADEVVGFVDVEDVLRSIEDGEETVRAGDLARDLIIVPETTSIADLLLQFRDEHQQMAAVIDEWGAFEGIATVEDIVEALVGDLRDGFDLDEREPSIRRRDDEGYEIDGGVPLSKVTDTLAGDFEREEVETIGVLVLGQLNRAPEPGDRVEIAGHVVEVTSVEGTRISTVWVHERDMDDSVMD
jgi:CBS domain containing-hemolysin-like protein